MMGIRAGCMNVFQIGMPPPFIVSLMCLG